MSTATQKVFLPAIFTCSHITFAMVCSFYFLLVGSRRNECNSLWGDKGKRLEVYCYPESMPAGIFIFSHITYAILPPLY